MEARHKASFLALQDILGDPGTVSRVGRKGGTNVFITGERAPGYRNSPNYFQRFKLIPARDWAQKILCIIVPNWRTVSPEFFSWVRTRRLLSRHTCPVRSPRLFVQGKLSFSTFLTRNKGTTDELKKRLGYYQQEQLNLPREYSVFDGSQLRCGGDEKFKWVIAWKGKTTTLHVHRAFLYTFLCRQLHDYSWKCQISRFVKDVNKQ